MAEVVVIRREGIVRRVRDPRGEVPFGKPGKPAAHVIDHAGQFDAPTFPLCLFRCCLFLQQGCLPQGGPQVDAGPCQGTEIPVQVPLVDFGIYLPS